MSKSPDRTLAPHVQAMISTGAQAKPLDPLSSAAKPAPHVLAAIGVAQCHQAPVAVGAPKHLPAPKSVASSHPSTPRLAGPGLPRSIQRKKTVPSRIEEGDWATVGAKGTLSFTPLSAGCLAVVASFSTGGGAGVHLALNVNNASQWGAFRNAVAAKPINSVHLYSDMVGQAQGWYVKFGLDDMLMPTGPETEMSPRSSTELAAEYGSTNLALRQGWACDTASTQQWFKAALNAGSVIYKNTNSAVIHHCK